MIGSISHSIKGVLTGLDAGVYLLNKGLFKRDDAQVQSGLEIVRSIAERIRKMVMDILFCAKERELQRERIDVRAFAEDVVRTVQPLYRRQKRGTGVRVRPPTGGLRGRCRDAAIGPHQPAGKRRRCLRGEGSVKSYRTVFGIEANAEVVGILVEDNGIGMTPEQLKNLFTVFFSTKGSKGTGLGLFITDKIVRQHGGTITVDSAVGRGARFGIMIPRRGGFRRHRGPRVRAQSSRRRS